MNIAVASRVSPERIPMIRDIVPSADIRVLPSADQLEPHLSWADVVFGNIEACHISAASRLKWVQLTSAGFDAYLGVTNPVLFTTSRGVTADCGAEHTLGMMIALAHAFPFFQGRQRDRQWDRQPARPRLLTGATLGILGLGAYGSALAVRAKALGMRVLAIRRTAPAEPPPSVDQLWTLDRLDDLLADSDHVVIHLPLTAETRGIMNPQTLRKMKPTAYLYNTARGGIIDEPALVEALRKGVIAGAGLDVFREEPLPADSPLWDLPNVIITPHVAGCWAGMWDAAFDLFCDNLKRYIAGLPLLNVADFSRGY